MMLSLPVRIASAGAVALGLALSAPATVLAQQSPEQLQQALTRAQAMLRQQSQQRAQMEADLARLRNEHAATERKLETLNGQVKTLQQELAQTRQGAEQAQARSAATQERAERQFTATRQELNDLAAKHEALTAEHASLVSGNERLEMEFAAVTRDLEDARQRNLALYQTVEELASLYTDKSAMDALMQREPFTGIKRVQIQNMMQQFKDDAYLQLLDSNLESAGQAEP
ncbi:MAG: hypothetical protein H6978_08250 [Gammaproteobacteria bacterium]|nr:hypothetical protein [Gammaproteobacteria bacterium]